MKKAVRLGVVGLGRGLYVASDIAKESGVKIAAVCDHDPQKLEKAVKKLTELGVTQLQAFENFDDFLKADIDAVYIATDAIFHVPFVTKAMEAGKHVISEIPAVSSLEDAKSLKAAVQAHPELKYMTGENCFYWGFIEAWKKMYDDGKFGTTVYAEAEYLHSSDPREWDHVSMPSKGHWRTFNPAIKYITHDLGPLLHIMNDRCVSVSCMVPDVCYNPNKTLEAQNGIAIFKTAKGAVIRILICFGAYVGCDHNFRIIGTKGTIQTDTNKPLSEAYSYARFDDIPGSIDTLVEIPITASSFSDGTSGHGGADRKMMLDFIKCIQEDTEPPIDVDMGIAMALPGIIAAESASRGGALLEIPEI